MTRASLILVSIAMSSTAPLYAQSLEVVRKNNEFAIDFYKECSFKTGSGNVFISPFSISSAVAMIYAGARGQTAEEMKKAMYFLKSLEKQNEEYSYLMDDFKKENSPFIVSNMLWTQAGTNFDPDFVKTNTKSFGAGLHQVDFGASKKVEDEINSTIAKQTNNKIQNLMPEGSLNPDVRIVLTNAVYFKDVWAKVFKKEETREGDFHSSAEKTVKAMFMHQKGHFKSFENEVVSGIELPFRNGDYSMLMLLPKISMDEFESDFFEADTYSTWQFESQSFDKILIPRFKIEQETEPKSILEKLGMKKAFREGEADFSGITNEQDLAISGIFHKAFVEVNEEGAEAAAATGVVAEQRSLSVPHQFIADRAFIFLIRENHSGSILFIGKLIDP